MHAVAFLSWNLEPLVLGPLSSFQFIRCFWSVICQCQCCFSLFQILFVIIAHDGFDLCLQILLSSVSNGSKVKLDSFSFVATTT